jgi:hypothetical protein
MCRKLIYLVSFTLVLGLGTGAANAQPLQQDPGPDGIVSAEAENFDENTTDGTRIWEFNTDPTGFSGDGFMRAVPDGSGSGTPQLDFEIEFVKTGIHYVWVRGYRTSGTDDSCHTGLDGDETTSDKIQAGGTNNTWEWSINRRDNAGLAQVDVTSLGVHTFHVRMREDGWRFDKFVLTTNANYTPTGNGPPESPRGARVVAFDPIPADGATDVPREVVLSWTPGEFAPPVNGHTVYLSEIFTDVNDGIGGMTQDASSYAPPQRLDFGTTYYWRVDEVNGPPDNTVYEGSVWSFTTELLAYPIENIIATASSNSPAKGPENTINGSGLDDSGLLHDKIGDDAMWLSDTAGPQPTWIEFEFDGVYKLYEMWVWNSNETMEPVIGFGFKDVTIEYSTNGVDYMTLGTTHEFARASGASDYAHNTTIDMPGVGAKYVKLTANSNWGGILPQFGLSEVRFFYIPVLAREPNPESGATGVSIGTIDAPADLTLGFRAGREAAKHDVYFSSDWQAVIDGTAAVTTVTEASHGPLSLDLAQTYYWRVDEVNEVETPTTWQGNVWDFSTQKYFVVDDFESYNDLDTTDPESNRIFLTWLDGYEVATNGSLVGYDVPPFAEQTIVHGDKQSMPLFFDNSGTAQYSEATLTLSPQQDWTIKNIEALVLWFKGNAPGFVEDPAGTYTMTAAGVDIWNQADEFRYAWKQLSGDGEITATVNSVLWVPGANDWTKAGVMIRKTLEAGSANAFVAITTGAGDGATFQWRNSAGGSSSSSRTLTGISPPASIKLVRAGNTFTGYVFQNGQWQQQGESASVPMPDPVYIGLALTSHSSGITSEAVFSDVQTTGAVTGVFTDQAIGVDMPSNDGESMYVAVASSGGTPAVVRHDDPGATQSGDWTEWSIDLKQLSDAGVNLTNVNTNVNTISIGVGDKANPQPGGAGLVFVDDIRLYPHREPPDEIQLEAEAADSITAPMKIYDDPTASGGQYIGTDDGIGDENSNPPPDGIATYSFTAKGGTYKILLSVIITGGSNSFWVRIPGAISYDPGTDPANPGWIRFNDIEDGDTWHWDEVHSNDHDNKVVTIMLPPGPHKLEIVRREDGALLDAILITDAVD